MPHAEALRHFVHRHQELIASQIWLRTKKARGSAAGFLLARYLFAPRLRMTTIFQDLVSKTLTAGSITPGNGGRPQGRSIQRQKGCSQFVA
jgi:hypothetical protein